ncbi:MAG: VWA domain-containing protein, partial [Rhodospirillaceae bacterium]|nr:VWA domain-containing protein [Rhodospirillaceae bacterium]
YEKVWKDNRRRHTEHIPTSQIINTYGPDWKLIFVGDATMSPYEIVYPGGSVEHWNEEAGQVWMERMLGHFRHSCWLNPVPERHWEYTPSLQMLEQIMGNRMYGLTLDGLDKGMRSLNR